MKTFVGKNEWFACCCLYYFPCDVLNIFRLEEAESRVLSFLLEFVNWKTLPPMLLHILSQRRAENTWSPHKHFGKDD